MTNHRIQIADNFLYWGYRISWLSDTFIKVHGLADPVHIIITNQGSDSVPTMMDAAIYKGIPLPASPEHTFEWEFGSDLAKEVQDWVMYWRKEGR